MATSKYYISYWIIVYSCDEFFLELRRKFFIVARFFFVKMSPGLVQANNFFL